MKVASVPQIEGLTIEDFLNFGRANSGILKYLPDAEDWLHLDKKWITDLLYSLEPDGVQEMIDHALKERRHKMEEKQNLVIQMRPEFMEALQHSINFSSIDRS